LYFPLLFLYSSDRSFLRRISPRGENLVSPV
jgi:hypothetical protein